VETIANGERQTKTAGAVKGGNGRYIFELADLSHGIVGIPVDPAKGAFTG
jgi:hypothetical protein